MRQLATQFPQATNFETIDAFLDLIAFVRSEPGPRAIFDGLCDGPVDMMSIPLSDYKVEQMVDGRCNITLKLKKWSFEFNLDNNYYWNRSNVTLRPRLSLRILYDGHWVYAPSYEYFPTEIRRFDAKANPEAIIGNMTGSIKRRYAITIREGQKYLADRALYDNMATLFNIKPRKKKK